MVTGGPNVVRIPSADDIDAAVVGAGSSGGWSVTSATQSLSATLSLSATRSLSASHPTATRRSRTSPVPPLHQRGCAVVSAQRPGGQQQVFVRRPHRRRTAQ